MQILLGALVAGNQAGLVYNDWPLFAGHLLPATTRAPASGRRWRTARARCSCITGWSAYLLWSWRRGHGRRRLAVALSAAGAKGAGAAVGLAVVAQALLGIATLMARVPIGLGVAHQLMAALTLSLAVALAWRVRRV